MATLMIPQSLAFSFLAGLPAVMGVTASVVSLIIYSFMGSSKHLSLGPDALSSLLFGVAISLEAHHYGSDPWATATTLTVLIAACLLILRILKAGFIDSVLSGCALLDSSSVFMVVKGLTQAEGIQVLVSLRFFGMMERAGLVKVIESASFFQTTEGTA
jgi:SulP family sulfate permease